MRDDRERLLDIADAIDRINKYAERGREVFEQDELVQNWIPASAGMTVGARIKSNWYNMWVEPAEGSWPPVVGAIRDTKLSHQ